MRAALGQRRRRRISRVARAWVRRIGFGAAIGVLSLAPPGHAESGFSPHAALDATSASALCIDAVHTAERRYHLPPGLLFAISLVESGRPNTATHLLQPWPWTVQAQDQGLYFDSKSQAVQWVRDAMARGVSSIDTGCLQVNLLFHPHAFETLDAAFDPSRNADYAARFLLRLHATAGDWRQAVGFYHSQTQALATPYEARVDHMLGGVGLALPAQPKRPTLLSELADAWRATLGNGEPAVETTTGNDRQGSLRGPSRLPATKLSP